MGIRDWLFGKKGADAEAVDETTQEYVESCLALDIEQLDDDRKWFNMDDMRRIQDLADSGQPKKALALAQQGLDKYPDFYYLHIKIATLLNELGEKGAAEEAYLQGLGRSRRKHNVCDRLGWHKFEQGDFEDAVRWWMKSAVLQLTTGTIDSPSPFLNLAYIAEGFRLQPCTKFLLELTDKAGPSIRFDRTGGEQRFRVATHQHAHLIKGAIVAFCERYM